MSFEWNEGMVKPAYEFYEAATEAYESKIAEGYSATIQYLL
jgi:hypothetical protein